MDSKQINGFSCPNSAGKVVFGYRVLFIQMVLWITTEYFCVGWFVEIVELW